MITIESCCTSLEQALAAQSRGANRIELCIDLSVGGITPTHDLIRQTISQLSIPVNVLVRDAKCLDFVYDNDSLNRMINDIEFCRMAGAAGVVIGALNSDGYIDIPTMQRLMAAAQSLSVTFHRAFDVCSETPQVALEKVISLGCQRVLSSGQAAHAWEGRMVLAEMVEQAAGRIIVMPGCGVRPDNLDALRLVTHASEFHGTAIP